MRHTVYTDKEGNQLEAYVNGAGLVYIKVGDPEEDNYFYGGYICLGKSDVEHLIKNLQELLNNYEVEETQNQDGNE